MKETLKSKILDAEQSSKLIGEINLADYEMVETNEIKTVVAILLREQEKLTEKLSVLARESGYDACESDIKKIKSLVKGLMPIINKRISAEDLSNETVIELIKDEINTTVNEEGETVTSTTEVVDSATSFKQSSCYSVLNVSEYNELSGESLDEKTHLFKLINKLVDEGLTNCVLYGKRYLSTFPDNIVSEIIEKNNEWNTLVDNFSINKTRLNSGLDSLDEDSRNAFIDNYFIKKDYESKTKKPKYRQQSLFEFANEGEN